MHQLKYKSITSQAEPTHW